MISKIKIEIPKSFMRSTVQERVISTVNTFREEGVFSGDKITEIIEI